MGRKPSTIRLKSTYTPPAGTQASTMFAALVVAVRAGLSESSIGHARLERYREKFLAWGIDITDEQHPAVAGFEDLVDHWLNETKQ